MAKEIWPKICITNATVTPKLRGAKIGKPTGILNPQIEIRYIFICKILPGI